MYVYVHVHLKLVLQYGLHMQLCTYSVQNADISGVLPEYYLLLAVR